MYVLQRRYHKNGKWEVCSYEPMATLEEARAQLDRESDLLKPISRIAEVYTQVRYKAVRP